MCNPTLRVALRIAYILLIHRRRHIPQIAQAIVERIAIFMVNMCLVKLTHLFRRILQNQRM